MRAVSDAASPSSEQLRAGLHEVFGAPVELLEREPNPSASTFASERVTCRPGTGRTIHLFCKHSGGYTPDDRHHGGVAYEAAVYDRLLSQAPVSLPTFHGAFRHAQARGETLVIEYLGDAARLSGAPMPVSMISAATWIGTFHRHAEAMLDPVALSFLNVYDLAYFRRWASRTRALAEPLIDHYPWLARLCGVFAEVFAERLLEGATVVHGEYYPHNVLVREGRVLPVDWESAAVAAGEIDLATLTEEWPPEVADGCARAYREARWPSGERSGFQDRLSAARLYLHLRWLGDRKEWTLSPGHRWRFERLGAFARQLGIA